MDELARLFGESTLNDRAGVPERVHGDTGDQVEILASLDIPHAAALAALDDHGRATVREECRLLDGDPIGAGLRADNGGGHSAGSLLRVSLVSMVPTPSRVNSSRIKAC